MQGRAMQSHLSLLGLSIIIIRSTISRSLGLR